MSGACEIASEGNICERYIWVITPVHHKSCGIECGFQLVEGGVCVNCCVEPGPRGQGQTYRNVVSTNEETSCAYGALLCDTIISLQHVPPSSRLVSTMPSAHRWNREVSRCSKKNPWSQQRRTSDF